MKYEIRSFLGFCPKDNVEKLVPICYQPTYLLSVGNCLDKSFPKCRCGKDCPAFQDAPEHLPING